MTIGDLIKKYISEHNLSYEEFGRMCGLSKGYISMIINNRNPSTGKPPQLKLKTYTSIANVLGTNEDSLFRMVDGALVYPNPANTSTSGIEYTEEELKAIRQAKSITPDIETAAAKAMETLIRYKISRAPILPMSILQSMPNVLVVTFTEMAGRDGLDQSNAVTMFGAENQDIVTYYRNGKYCVAYNQRLPYYMLQRAMARELGHILLSHNTKSIPDDVKMNEALYFSRHLLCPRPLLKYLMDEGITLTVETLGNITGLYGRSLAGIRETPGVHIPAKQNRKVREQFTNYLQTLVEFNKFTETRCKAIAEFGTYMDNYEE